MIPWFKKHWQTLLVVVLAFLLLRRNNLGLSSVTRQSSEFMALPSADMALSSKLAPPSEDPNRLIITDTSLSLVVKDVARAITDIQSTATSLDGFLIDSYLSQPESAASGSISIRIPSDKLPQALSAFKDFAVKVVSESVSGVDVTDSYTDLSARLEVLTKTKTKFEQILDQATKVPDLLEVQRELTSLQAQIDNLKGQQKYYEQSAKLSKVTVYLSTDELSLPYAPTNAWRPTVIFKTAVRSLVGTARSLGSVLIWLAVYIPVIIPAILIIRFVKKRKAR
ncbi:DUF4349 domain-containing protein [Patescibacteria group bacterium]|nr:DUF4349 domain-containing protein [Patescibacteria group bacterium]